MSEPNGVRDILQQAGFRDAQLTGLEQPMHFGATAEDAYRFVLGLLGWMLQALDEPGHQRALDALRASVRAHETAEGVTYGSATWIVTARKA
jgi:hypothetical protein